jgi:hypothetical protein
MWNTMIILSMLWWLLTLQMHILFFNVNSVNDFEVYYIDNSLYISSPPKKNMKVKPR